MTDGARLQGFDGIDNMLKRLPGRVARRVVNSATISGASVIRKEARVRLKPMRSTGRLSKSLMVRTVERASNFVRVQMGPARKAFWGSLIEFGTKYIKSKPWLTPAFDSKKSEAVKVIGVKLWAGIVKNMKQLKR